jgi:hypothetical protein
MEAKPKLAEFAAAAGISISYASQLLSEHPKKRRDPSQALAITIYRRTGRKFGPIAHLSDADIAALERIAAKTPPRTPAADAGRAAA